ncbi:hypothetical protein HY572_05580 [Candidatus Micrarchaeota archaeon]|nr:hypothetical protein [Candidatus Micrarchaeota archaeon]
MPREDYQIYMGEKEGWKQVASALGMTEDELWLAVRTKKIKAVESHERVYIIPPDEELRLTGRI